MDSLTTVLKKNNKRIVALWVIVALVVIIALMSIYYFRQSKSGVIKLSESQVEKILNEVDREAKPVILTPSQIDKVMK